MKKMPAVSYLFLVLALISLACFAVPIYVIRPFRHQGAGELAVALAVKQIGPIVSIVCAVFAAFLFSVIWLRTKRWLPRTGAAVALAATIGGAYLARLNVYELMFHPIDAPRFLSAAKVKVDADDMVIAVDIRGSKRAYPIREMAYHHIVNDIVAGEPIAATY